MTSTRKKKPIAQHAYNLLAEDFARLVDTKPYNAYYERPAMLSLLPNVRGKRILDVGCGPGAYSEWLVNHGARVIAFDVNRKMVRLARQRLGDRAQVLLADLASPLDFASDASFEIIVAPLVLDYLEDWAAVFNEFYRVLKPGGILVFSMEHPFGKYYDFQATCNYFNTDLVSHTWHGFGQPVVVPTYRRSLMAVFNPLLQAGFTLDYLLEPRPTQEFEAADPKDYEVLMRSPGFMCIRAMKKIHLEIN